MKRRIMLGAFLVIGAVLFSGCVTLHARPQSKSSLVNTSIKLNVTQPVAIKNVSSKTPGDEEVLCKLSYACKIKGNLYVFTESAVGTVKEIMQKNNITIDDKADKKLELSINSVEAVANPWSGHCTARVTLTVKTGSGLQREFDGKKIYFNAYHTNSAFEMAIAQSVERMLQDQYITEYLEK